MAILDAVSPSSLACSANSFICAWMNSVCSAITWRRCARRSSSPFVGAILIEPALFSAPLLVPALVLRRLAGRLIAAPIPLRRLALGRFSAGLIAVLILQLPLTGGFAAAAILLCLAASIAVAILKLPLTGGFAAAAILLRLTALIAVAILQLPLAGGFASAAILLRCTALVPLSGIISRGTLILLQPRRFLFLLRMSAGRSRNHAEGCRNNEKLVPVH
jgi:hypothetical protein